MGWAAHTQCQNSKTDKVLWQFLEEMKKNTLGGRKQTQKKKIKRFYKYIESSGKQV